MKCRLGSKKHRVCEEVTGRKYSACFVRGGWDHHVAECQHRCEEGWYIDYVNYKKKTIVQEKVLPCGWTWDMIEEEGDDQERGMAESSHQL